VSYRVARQTLVVDPLDESGCCNHIGAAMFVNEAGPNERNNAMLTVSKSSSGRYQVVLISTTSIANDAEILVDYGPNYDRSDYITNAGVTYARTSRSAVSQPEFAFKTIATLRNRDGDMQGDVINNQDEVKMRGGPKTETCALSYPLSYPSQYRWPYTVPCGFVSVSVSVPFGYPWCPPINCTMKRKINDKYNYKDHENGRPSYQED